ncbi:bifunctional DNA primase/polymerase [Paractinoplanes rishiriensis]|uniref:DNA primase n=1 Tax=Paractinoplanes rishiriensis TaxID=1050105 RepID=A0A919JXR8_9ACTN|nr:bifunctional DNA primase/polymerase [Actinoplanes rishiriensis]GIE96703.1 DNA primase [Actinoplanes rishiriensis]
MQWTVHRPFVPPALVDRLDRIRLRRAAIRYAEHGWPVTPGARLTGHRFLCGRPGCPIMTCHPALESWEDSASTDLGRVHSWWRHGAYTVLLATGWRFDVLEVPASLGLRVLGTSRLLGAGALGPVAVTAAGRWMFLTRPGSPLRSELDHRLDVVRHGLGSWIPAPPTRMLEGPVRWAVRPERTQWRLPEAEVVQSLLVDALGTVRTPRLTVPRQMSTARRAV